jgi:hypothetical protein
MPRVERSYPPALQAAVDAALAKQNGRAVPSSTSSRERAKGDTAPKPTSRRDTLNGTEAAYLAHLEIRKAAGELVWIGEHESIAFRIADGEGKGKKASYRPDFPVIDSYGRLFLYEVKGHWREAARLRIKVAASIFRFRFVAVTKAGDGWNYEEFGFAPSL